VTFYRTSRDLAEVVKNATSLPGAMELLDVLDSWTAELIPVDVVPARKMLPTYEIRLARSEAGEGPRIIGLRELVDVLRCGDQNFGLFTIQTLPTNYMGLLDERGSTLLSLVTISRPDLPEDRRIEEGDFRL
jgi:hypothetical protein